MKENYTWPSISFEMHGERKHYAIKDIPNVSKLVLSDANEVENLAICNLWLQPYDADHIRYLDQCSKLN